MENYRILKLKNGDSVIAGLGSITEKNTLILERPMQFKTMTVMDDKSMGVRDYLLIRNWAEYSTDKAVEIPNDSILAILQPDEKLVMVYNLEKEKEDNPQEITPLNLPPQGMDENDFPMQKMNIQLQLPPEASEQFLELLGIEFEDLDDEADEEEEDPEDLDLEDDADFQPPPPPPVPSARKSAANKNKRDPSLTFGNSPDDWSPDPNDYLK
jgi:hypothetical protein